MELKRNCPNCNCIIEYKTKSQYNNAIDKSRICKKCSNTNIAKNRSKNHKKYSKVCISCGNVHVFSNHSKWKKSKPDICYKCKKCALVETHTGKCITDDHKIIISNTMRLNWKLGKYRNTILKSKERWRGAGNPMYNSHRIGILNPFFGNKHTDITKKKISFANKNPNNTTRHRMSLSASERVVRTGMPSVNYNPKSIPIIDEYGKKYGYNFQHAENGGEFKFNINGKFYFVDGYDAEKNVVIEYYETFHKNNIEKDLQRQLKIEKFLKCKFIILKEWTYNTTSK
jgi:hypothetical protein